MDNKYWDTRELEEDAQVMSEYLRDLIIKELDLPLPTWEDKVINGNPDAKPNYKIVGTPKVNIP